MVQEWKYSDAIPKERQERFLSIESFAAVVDNIEREMSILCYHLQGCDDDLSYSRPVFCIRVQPAFFDVFFNSPNGYRGTYCESSFYGLECNHFLMKRLFPRLSDWATKNSPGYNAQFCQDALLAVSAKAWLAERSMELCTSCEGEWSRPKDDKAEIVNGRWDVSNQPNARFGRKAPEGSKLRLFGAFLNWRGDEFVPARKRDRHHQIHFFGWS